MPTLFVVMPVYNEPNTLDASVARVRAASVRDGWLLRIILIDDGSSDATPAQVRALATDPSVTALFHPANRGKGAAIRTGFAHALEMASETGSAMRPPVPRHHARRPQRRQRHLAHARGLRDVDHAAHIHRHAQVLRPPADARSGG